MQKFKINFLYPKGDCLNPITGGQVYDGYLLRKLMSYDDVEVNYITDALLGHYKTLYLPFVLFKNIHRLRCCDALFFNTALFPYFILMVIWLKIFSPKVKIFGIHHHFRSYEMTGIKRSMYIQIEKLCLKLCSGIISPNMYTIDQCYKLYDKVNIIFLEMSFDKNKKNKSVPISNKSILYVGSVYERKGLTYLMEAVGHMSSADRDGLVVKVVGTIASDKYYKELRRLIVSYGIDNNIVFTGRVDDKTLDALYREAYVFVLPSLMEGYGMVIIEAMAYGLPVIAFNNSAMPYTVKDGINGLLVNNKDSDCLREAILKVMNNPKLRSKLSKGAIDTWNNCRSMSDLDKDINRFIQKMVRFK